MVHVINYIKKHSFLLFLIVPAFLLYMLIIFPSGSNLCFEKSCGIFFWGVHGHDGIWHLAISNFSFNSFPFNAPTYFGAQMSGYNYLFDLIIRGLSLIGIPAIITYFKIFPVVWFLIFTSLLIVLARKIKDTPVFVFLYLFFTFFVGSFSYFLTLFHNKSIWGSASLLATLTVHTMSNLQFAFSLPILLGILIIIKNKKPNMKSVLMISALNFINLGIKFYGGAITSFVIIIYLLSYVNKKTLLSSVKYLFVLGLTSILSIIIFYDPFSSVKSGSVFSFSPLSLIHTITEEPSLFYSRQLTNARYFLIQNGIGPKLILIEAFNIAAFLFFYLGVRFFGFIYIFWQILRKKLDRFNLNILLTSIFAFTLTAVLVQKGEWWNVIQFFFYSIFLSNIFLAQLSERLFMSRSILLKFCVFLIIFFGIPTTIDVIRQYAVFPGSSYISKQELDALSFLKYQPKGVVLTPIYDPSLKLNKGLNDLFRAEDSAYVSAFTGKQSYFANPHPLRLMGIDVNPRSSLIKNGDCKIMSEIDYIYELHTDSKIKQFISCKNVIVKNIFANDLVTIFKVSN
ncbi:MAG: hypothetical protein NUV87_02485 [Candidatus Roizmanbacteria bacterium]|nr:hypothetical protein [Candidatus Roizmanbacteria bacterium]MCR4312953.1 hypothetical protein [Candidatus Roizmanbacteria bacterium]